jgi:hypothetical protein
VESGYDSLLPVDSFMSLQAIWLVWITDDYAAALTWITVPGGGVTFVVSERRNFPLDHRGCAVIFAWIIAAAP